MGGGKRADNATCDNRTPDNHVGRAFPRVMVLGTRLTLRETVDRPVQHPVTQAPPLVPRTMDRWARCLLISPVGGHVGQPDGKDAREPSQTITSDYHNAPLLCDTDRDPTPLRLRRPVTGQV